MGFALYNSKNDNGGSNIVNTEVLQEGDLGGSSSNSSDQIFMRQTFSSGLQSGIHQEPDEASFAGSSYSNGSGTSAIAQPNFNTQGQHTMSPGEMIAYNISASSSNDGGSGVGYNSISIPSQTKKSSKNKKESKNSFGTTIASAKTGIGNATDNGGTIDMPLAPPPPPVPLDGGTILVLAAGIIAALYKLYIQPAVAAKMLRNSND